VFGVKAAVRPGAVDSEPGMLLVAVGATLPSMTRCVDIAE
jgi:hypothetical protein